MRFGDQYVHFKGGEYIFSHIALPKNEAKHPERLQKHCLVNDAHTPDGEDIQQVILYGDTNETSFIDRPDPHVIYTSLETGLRWARKVDNFFSTKEIDENISVRRFRLSNRLIDRSAYE